MNKSITAVSVATVFTLSLLGGCNKPAGQASTPDTPTVPTAPDKPAAPESVASQDSGPAQPGSVPSASAGASVSVNGTEARAGDVSVKLPD